MKLIDASNLIMGRLASHAAKELLKGEKVIIINAEKCIISGSRESIFEKYAHRVERSSVINPRRFGPKYPRRPDGILRRAVRGMLPWRTTTGKRAYRNLRVYIGEPEEIKGMELEKMSLPDAGAEKLKIPRYVRLGDVSRHLGARW
ncbi:MAG: 50S ribosomal protein L13 [Methanobacteriota archaeon]|nr:MAG: 50S ribosomal protein L13 [Euryarchaeota archaeon]